MLNLYGFLLQVALCDLQMRGMSRDLLPGDPLCSPRATVLVEAGIQLMRRLHRHDSWTTSINKYMQARLERISPLMKEGRTGKVSRSQSKRTAKIAFLSKLVYSKGKLLPLYIFMIVPDTRYFSCSSWL